MNIILSVILTFMLSASALAENSSYNFDYSLDDPAEMECNDLPDPFEKINRKIFYFNSFLDHIILKPIAKAYGKVFSDYSRNRIGDFIDNIQEPLSTVNYGLQVNIDKVLQSFWRFTINTTFGIGGAYDLATEAGITHKPQTFGSTLAHYGVSSGPYIVIPFLGSTNMRDMWDLAAADDALNPLKYHMNKYQKRSYTGSRIAHKRHEIMPFTDYVTKNSTDPYISIRSALHQRRENNLSYPSTYKCGMRTKLKESYLF